MLRILGLATLAVAIGSGPAAAGPIRWSYSADVGLSGDYGSDFRFEWVNQARSFDTPVTDGYGYESVPLFTTTGHTGPPRIGATHSYSFTVWLTLTDEASRQSRTVSYGGWYSSEWVQTWGGVDGQGNPVWDWEWVSELSHFGNEPGSDTFEIGRNRYTIYASGGGRGSFPSGALTVEVSPSATPEPGTLALAGIGLVGVVVARRVRRAVT
jgi:hypothetical protein